MFFILQGGGTFSKRIHFFKHKITGQGKLLEIHHVAPASMRPNKNENRKS